MNRTLLYFPWAHGTLHHTAYTNPIITADYCKIQNYFDKEFLTSYGTVDRFYVFMEGYPAFNLEATQRYIDLLESQGSEIARNGSDFIREQQQLLYKMAHGQFVYNLEDRFHRKFSFMDTENLPMLIASNRCVEANLPDRVEAIIPSRDEFVADQIDKNLPANSIGLLFIGHRHNVKPILPPDINVLFPIGEPCPIK